MGSKSPLCDLTQSANRRLQGQPAFMACKLLKGLFKTPTTFGRNKTETRCKKSYM